MGTSGDHLLNFAGQTVVEYVLLLFVLMSLGMGVFNSDAFKNFFGPDSEAFAKLRLRMEYNYRYTQDGRQDNFTSYMNRHDSYIAGDAANSRFFMPLEKYGE